MTKNTKKLRDCLVGEPPPDNEGPAISNPYPAPSETPDYISIGPEYQALYKYLKNKAARLKMQFNKIKSMT